MINGVALAQRLLGEQRLGGRLSKRHRSNLAQKLRCCMKFLQETGVLCECKQTAAAWVGLDAGLIAALYIFPLFPSAPGIHYWHSLLP